LFYAFVKQKQISNRQKLNANSSADRLIKEQKKIDKGGEKRVEGRSRVEFKERLCQASLK